MEDGLGLGYWCSGDNSEHGQPSEYLLDHDGEARNWSPKCWVDACGGHTLVGVWWYHECLHSCCVPEECISTEWFHWHGRRTQAWPSKWPIFCRHSSLGANQTEVNCLEAGRKRSNFRLWIWWWTSCWVCVKQGQGSSGKWQGVSVLGITPAVGDLLGRTFSGAHHQADAQSVRWDVGTQSESSGPTVDCWADMIYSDQANRPIFLVVDRHWCFCCKNSRQHKKMRWLAALTPQHVCLCCRAWWRILYHEDGWTGFLDQGAHRGRSHHSHEPWDMKHWVSFDNIKNCRFKLEWSLEGILEVTIIKQNTWKCDPYIVVLLFGNIFNCSKSCEKNNSQTEQDSKVLSLYCVHLFIFNSVNFLDSFPGLSFFFFLTLFLKTHTHTHTNHRQRPRKKMLQLSIIFSKWPIYPQVTQNILDALHLWLMSVLGRFCVLHRQYFVLDVCWLDNRDTHQINDVMCSTLDFLVAWLACKTTHFLGSFQQNTLFLQYGLAERPNCGTQPDAFHTPAHLTPHSPVSVIGMETMRNISCSWLWQNYHWTKAMQRVDMVVHSLFLNYRTHFRQIPVHLDCKLVKGFDDLHHYQ